jgi:acid phosphatase (class A)
MKSVLMFTALAVVFSAPLAAQTTPAKAGPAKAGFQFLAREDALPQRLLAQPAPNGSAIQVQELALVKALVAGAAPERLAQAKADDQNETPTIFNDALGVDLNSLPATAKLLETFGHEAETGADIAKVAFMRQRPWAVDKAITTCTEAKASKEFTSYPSGHAAIGYAMAAALVQVAPNYAPGILTRADDYALSRTICGHHYPSDTAASRALALQVADRLLADPRLASEIKAAREELVAKGF